MKIRSVVPNNRRREFEIVVGRNRVLAMPYAKLDPAPTPDDRVAHVYVDPELGREALTYELESGAEGSVHLDAVREYNADPDVLQELLVHHLTIEVARRVEEGRLAKRELIRRLGTSATQLYRLLDPSNTRKSIGQLVAILHLLDCDVEIAVRERRRKKPPAESAATKAVRSRGRVRR